MVARKNIDPSVLELHRSLIMSHPMVMLVIDPNDGRIVDANLAAARFYGWPVEMFQQMNISEINTLPPETVQAELKHTSLKQRNCFEFQHRLADGKIREVEVHSLPMPWNGKTMLCSMISDVTERNQSERMRTEAALRESLERNRTILQTTSDGFCVVSADGKIIDVNDSYCAMLGYTRDEVMNLFIFDIDAVELREEEAARIMRIHKNGSEIFETRHRRKDGSDFDVEISTTILPNSAGQMVAFCRNISERKQAEHALRTSESRFHNLIKKLPLPLAIINKAGEHTYINDRFVQEFGYTYEDLPTQKKWRELAYPDEKYREWVSETWDSAIANAKITKRDVVGPIEFDLTCKSNLVHSVMVSGIDLGDEVLATFTDITERRSYEKKLKTSFERRKKTELMRELLQGRQPSAQTVYESARIMGKQMMDPFTCFLIAIDSYQNKQRPYWQDNLEEYRLLIESILDVLEAENRFLWDSSEGIGVLCFVPADSENMKNGQIILANQLRETIAAKIPEVEISIGIAEHAGNMADIGKHYEQANTAVNTGKNVWPQLKTHHYLDIGVYQLLSCFKDEKQVSEYIERTIGKLLHYNSKKSEVYLNTLEVILTSDNLKAGAGALSVHYQTLMLRKQRLEKILEVSFDNFSARTAMLTALQLLKIRKH